MDIVGTRRIRRLATVACLAGAVLCLAPAPSAAKKPAKSAAGAPEAFQPAPNDVARPDGLPELGRWMYDKRLNIAQWLGGSLQGRKLREPVNIVIVDRVSSTPLQAKARFLRACVGGGYKIRLGHSAGYRGFIGGRLYAQLPDERDHAFSNEPFELQNNHGRAFGPAPASAGPGYVFTAALSRERYDPATKTQHIYVSFNQARDNFVESLSATRLYKPGGTIEMGNKLTDDPALTTGDHDGRAVVLHTAE